MLRHTRPDIKEGVCYGITDIGVKPSSCEKDIADVVAKISNIRPSTIYCSPLLRCQILAQAISKSGDIIVDDRLQEMNFGEWEMRAWQDIFDSNTGKEWFNDYLNIRAPKGESFADVVRRANSFLNSISKQSGDMLLITHAGFMRAAKVATGEIDIDKVFDLKIEYGEIIELCI